MAQPETVDYQGIQQHFSIGTALEIYNAVSVLVSYCFDIIFSPYPLLVFNPNPVYFFDPEHDFVFLTLEPFTSTLQPVFISILNPNYWA